LEEVLRDNHKVIVDERVNNVVPFLPLNELGARPQAPNPAPPGVGPPGQGRSPVGSTR
jgi:hypothetical protein